MEQLGLGAEDLDVELVGVVGEAATADPLLETDDRENHHLG
jgi:hypothetical protein